MYEIQQIQLVLDLFLLCDGNININMNINSRKPNCRVLPNSEAPTITEFVNNRQEAQQAASEGLGWEQAWKEEPD